MCYQGHQKWLKQLNQQTAYRPARGCPLWIVTGVAFSFLVYWIFHLSFSFFVEATRLSPAIGYRTETNGCKKIAITQIVKDAIVWWRISPIGRRKPSISQPRPARISPRRSPSDVHLDIVDSFVFFRSVFSLELRLIRKFQFFQAWRFEQYLYESNAAKRERKLLDFTRAVYFIFISWSKEK